MLYNLLRTCNGKQTIMMRDNYSKVRARMKILKQSTSDSQKIEYKMNETDSETRYYRESKSRGY